MSDFMGFEDAITAAKSPTSDSGDGQFVMFYSKPFRDEAESNEQERPVYVKKTFVKIMSPGNDKEVVDRLVRSDDPVIQRYPIEYARFKNGQNTEEIDGTDLVLFPLMDPGLVLTFKEMGVKTVEQLTQASDVNLQNLPRGVELKHRAKAWLEGQTAELGKLKKEVDALKALIANLDPGAHAATLKRQIREVQDVLGGDDGVRDSERHSDRGSAEGGVEEQRTPADDAIGSE